MSYSSVTPYLGLRNINLKSDTWYQDYIANNARTDLLGKHVRIQNGPGEPIALRLALLNGNLADAIKVLPKDDGSLEIYLGRQNSKDVVYLAGDPTKTSVKISNSNPSSVGRNLYLRGTFNAAVDSTFLFDNQDLNEVSMASPTYSGAKFMTWKGSAAQLELERSSTTALPWFLSFRVTIGGVAKTFVIPAYAVD